MQGEAVAMCDEAEDGALGGGGGAVLDAISGGGRAIDTVVIVVGGAIDTVAVCTGAGAHICGLREMCATERVT